MTLTAEYAIVFVLSAAAFDTVHYILHVWETSRYPLLRKLGALHAVHHDFLDRQMVIQRKYSSANLLNHVVPEYLTSVGGMVLLSFVFGWLPALLVFATRTVMFVVYLLQKGEDFTHRPVKRINANRSLIWVGPNYHALHHVYVHQHYSSFVNVFDMIMGTNCQIRDRKFLVSGATEPYGAAMVAELRRRGGKIETLNDADLLPENDSILETQLEGAEVVLLAHSKKPDQVSTQKITQLFQEKARDRLVPPEAWVLNSEKNLSSRDLTYRRIQPILRLSPSWAARISLFFISRGFRFILA